MSRNQKIRWLWQFDDLFTAPIFGYKDYMDYWNEMLEQAPFRRHPIADTGA